MHQREGADALLRATSTNFFDGMAQNIAGIDARLSRDLADGDITAFLTSRKRRARTDANSSPGACFRRPGFPRTDE